MWTQCPVRTMVCAHGVTDSTLYEVREGEGAGKEIKGIECLWRKRKREESGRGRQNCYTSQSDVTHPTSAHVRTSSFITHTNKAVCVSCVKARFTLIQTNPTLANWRQLHKPPLASWRQLQVPPLPFLASPHAHLFVSPLFPWCSMHQVFIVSMISLFWKIAISGPWKK